MVRDLKWIDDLSSESKKRKAKRKRGERLQQVVCYTEYKRGQPELATSPRSGDTDHHG